MSFMMRKDHFKQKLIFWPWVPFKEKMYEICEKMCEMSETPYTCGFQELKQDVNAFTSRKDYSIQIPSYIKNCLSPPFYKRPK